MSLHPMGDTAYLITLEDEMSPSLLARVQALAANLRADCLPGVVDIVPAYASVGVFYVPEEITVGRGELPWRVVSEWLERHLAGDAPAVKKPARAARSHVLPVCYGGDYGADLEAVARASKLTPEAVIKLHAGETYLVAAIGFAPGFPYLLGLPKKLATPRRTTPRLRVPAGSVAIGGEQTGVYPSETPGGWQLIGRTATRLFDPERAEPALMAQGDKVTFKPVATLPASSEVRNGLIKPDSDAAAAGGGAIEVIKPGSLTSVQDLGRRGFGALGVGVGGALDRWAAIMANLAVGNAPDAPLLECTYVGPILRFEVLTVVALGGAEVAGRPAGRPFSLVAGEELDCSSLTKGARLYLAVAGGLRVPRKMGGAGTVIGSGFGGFEGRALKAGDRLVFDPKLGAGVAGKTWRLASPVPLVGRKETIEVRLVPGPDWARIFKRMGPGGAERAVESRRFELSAKSDRMGLRLAGEAFTVSGGEEGWSRPVVPGTVQLPPDGQPIILMAEGQTIGGYAQLGQVASVDLAKLAQARPGAEIVFRVSELSTVQQARLKIAGDMARLRVGLAMQQ